LSIKINSKEYIRHRAFQLYTEKKVQSATALEVSLGTANKYIHSLGVEKDQFELTRLAAAFNCKPFLP